MRKYLSPSSLRYALLFTLSALISACGENTAVKPSTVAPSQERTQAQSLIDSPDASGENAYIHTQAFCSMGLRTTGTPAYEAQLRYLEKQLQALGWTTQRRTFPIRGKNMTNLYATYGEGKQLRPMMLSCHIDAKIGVSESFQAANDGASGAAALIEIARMLAKTPRQAQQVEIVFFDGEESFAWDMTHEDGLYGSTWDAERRASTETLPTWQINLDMVGGHRIPIAIPMHDTSTELYREYSRAIEALGLPRSQWTVAATSYLDDHIPYLRRGVKSINLIGDFVNSDWWHTDKDNMSLISKTKLEQSCRMTLQLITQLLGK